MTAYPSSNLASRNLEEFSRHLNPDQISVLVDSDTELNYDCISSPTEPEHQAVKHSHKAIKPSYTATRPSHEANACRSLEQAQPNEVADNNSTTLLYDTDSAQSSWQPQKELSAFSEKQFRRKLSYDQVCEILDAYNIPSVDCLSTPTLDPSIVNQISPPQTKKHVQDHDKEMAVVQGAFLNSTGPLCSLHDALAQCWK